MPIRTKEQARSAILQVLESRGSGIRTDAGEPIVDLVDGVSILSEQSSVREEYLRLINSLAGWRQVVADDAFKTRLAAALGIGADRATAGFLVSIGAPADSPSDVEGLIFVDLSNFAAGVGRPRRGAAFATAVERLMLASGSPFTLARGATVRRGSVLYDTTQDITGQTPAVDLTTGTFYVDVNVRCRTAGRLGNCIAGVINAVSGTLTGVTSVRNTVPAEGGLDRETNLQLLDRLALALSGTNIDTWRGLLDFVTDQVSVEDAILIRPGDPLMTRTAAGAVDVYVIGSRLTAEIAVTTIAASGESFTLPLQPVRAINSAVDDSSNQFFDGGGYRFVPDAGQRAGSAKAHSQVAWDKQPIDGGVGPAVGAKVTVAYTHNALIRDVQRRLDEDPVNDVPASDILVREATRTGVTVQLQAVPVAGISDLGLTQQDVNDAVGSALAAYFSGLKLGASAAFSDALVAAATTQINGVPVVDRVEGFAMGRTGASTGFEDIDVAGNEYLRLDAVTYLV